MTHTSTFRHTISLFRHFSCCLVATLLLSSCIGEDEFDNDPEGNFSALWDIFDRHYCFFAEKAEQYGLDWDEVYTRYSSRISSQMTDTQLFEVMGDMLSELRDGHVNLYSSWDVARNWSWHEDYPSNISDTLITKYLGTDYRIATGMRYRILDDNIGYIRLASFENSLGDGNLTEIFSYLLLCDGIIIDIRDNSGGQLSTADKLAARFTNQKTLVGYVRHKTGKGRNDFSNDKALYIEPSDGVRWQKPTVLLTNRSVFSAANHFTSAMHEFPLVTVLGDTTGGGSGMPFTQEIPNGWTVRYSAVVFTNAQHQQIEFGVAPDTIVSLDPSEALRGRDTLIETARQLLSQQQ